MIERSFCPSVSLGTSVKDNVMNDRSFGPSVSLVTSVVDGVMIDRSFGPPVCLARCPEFDFELNSHLL